MIAAAVLSVCAWNFPGSDPTTSRPAATLRAMGVTSRALAERIERGSYDELQPVRKGDRRLYGMSSGNARWCAGEVDTSAWAPDHVEWVRIYREGGIAIAVADVCRNFSHWRAGPDLAPLAPFLAPAAGIDSEPAGPIGHGPTLTPVALPLVSPAPDAPPPWPGAWLPGGYGSTVVSVICPECCIGVASAVPEPETFATLAMGLAALVWWKRRKA